MPWLCGVAGFVVLCSRSHVRALCSGLLQVPLQRPLSPPSLRPPATHLGAIVTSTFSPFFIFAIVRSSPSGTWSAGGAEGAEEAIRKGVYVKIP